MSTGLWQADQERHRDYCRFEKWLSSRSLGSSHGVEPPKRHFVIDVAFASSSPTDGECQYFKNVPLCLSNFYIDTILVLGYTFFEMYISLKKGFISWQ
jgi:hypothetical protein